MFSHILKVIAAYERRVVSGAAPFDRYVGGDRTALAAPARRGFQHFLRLQCDTCHNTPLFSDDEFHTLGLPSDPEPDLGRAQGLQRLQESLFRGPGPYADGPPVVRAEDDRPGQALVGSFRTPSLREVGSRALYGHTGALATLEEWLQHYSRVASLPPDRFVGWLDSALPRVDMTPQEKRDLIAFLQALSSDYASVWTQAPQDTEGLRPQQ